MVAWSSRPIYTLCFFTVYRSERVRGSYSASASASSSLASSATRKSSFALATVSWSSQQRPQKEMTFLRRNSLSSVADSCTNPPQSCKPPNFFPASALLPFLGTRWLHQSSPPPRRFPSITTARPLEGQPHSPWVIHATIEIRSGKWSLSLSTLSPCIQAPQFPSPKEDLGNDTSPQQFILQPDEPFTSNKSRLQQFPRHATSTPKSNFELRFSLPSLHRKSLSDQNSTIAKIILRLSHQLSSHTLHGSLLPQEETEDTSCYTQARKRTHRQLVGNINSLKLHCEENRSNPPTSEKHSTKYESFQQRSAPKKVSVSSTLKISGHKNREIPSSMIVNLSLSIHKKSKQQ